MCLYSYGYASINLEFGYLSDASLYQGVGVVFMRL